MHLASRQAFMRSPHLLTLVPVFHARNRGGMVGVVSLLI